MEKENNTGHNKPVNRFEVAESAAGSHEHGAQRKTILQWIKLFLNGITVEPFLLCYVMPNTISLIAVFKLNMEKACVSDLQYPARVCAAAVAGDLAENSTTQALLEAQQLVADMTAWRGPLQSGLPALAMLFVGAWSDHTGNRKALMIFPIVGELVSAIGLLLATYYFEQWPLWVTGVIEGLPPAICGGLSMALMGSYSYIADVTTVEERTFRIGVVAVIVTLGIPISSSISGVLTKAVGYYGIFSITIAMYTVGLIHTCFKIHNVKKTDVKLTALQHIKNFFNLRNVLDTFRVLFVSRGSKLLQIILLLIAYLIFMGPIFGEAGFVYYYLLNKFGMDEVEYSLFSTYSTVMGIAGTAISITVVIKLLKQPDAVLGILANVSKVASNLVYAFAPTKAWFYAGPAVDIFGSTTATAVKSIATKIVEPDEVGRIYSIISEVEALAPVMYTPLYSGVYKASLRALPGAIYLLAAFMTVPALLIFVFLYIWHKREQRDVVRDPRAKEKHAHDNDVTAL